MNKFGEDIFPVFCSLFGYGFIGFLSNKIYKIREFSIVRFNEKKVNIWVRTAVLNVLT